MANHGALVYRNDLDLAVERSRLLEWACTVYWRAVCVGIPRTLAEDQLQAVRDQLEQRNYGSLLGAGR